MYRENSLKTDGLTRERVPCRLFYSGSGSCILKLCFLQKTGEYAILNKKETRYGICC